MQIINRWINRIKNNKYLFQYLSNKLYKFFNVIERNDLVKVPGTKKIYRVVDVYDSGYIDVVCDEDPSPMRESVGRYGLILHSKFFKGIEHYRSIKQENRFRMFNFDGKIGFFNIKTKEVLMRGQKTKTGKLQCK